MKEKDLDYFKKNAEEDYMKTPISVLRYITELEQRLEEPNAKENWVPETSLGIYDGYRNKITGEWITESEYVRKFGPY
jgi:hypothetical protein